MAIFTRASCAAALSLGLVFSGASGAMAADPSTNVLQTPDYVSEVDKVCTDYAAPSAPCINIIYNAAMDMSSDLMRNSNIIPDSSNEEETTRNRFHFDICVRHRETGYSADAKYGPRPFLNQAEYCLDEAAKINDYYQAAYSTQTVEGLLSRVRQARTSTASPK